MKYDYIGVITNTEKIDFDEFKLHSHDGYEIYMFLEGDTQYIVEGRVYPLKKYDIILISPGEMHRAYHNSNHRYRRIVFNASDTFFKGEREIYLKIFQNRSLGAKNKIGADITKNSGLLDSIVRWAKYTGNGKNYDSAIGRAIFTEILHILNTLSPDDGQSSIIGDVISYINENFDSKITLDELSEKFFFSKEHLCRIFKKATGYTITEYINNRRILKIKELCRKGAKIEYACIESGFSSYSAFYKAYKKENKTKPRTGILDL